MRIQHNIMAMNAYRNYNNNASKLSKNLEKLSSGYRINRAGDDAAGLAISEKMRAQIAGLNQAQNNVKDGISLVKTAEGAMQEVQDMLNRMVTLATQSANGTYDNDVDRANLQKEVDSLRAEIDRIADSANFNGINLLDGSLEAGQLSELPVEFNTVTTADGVTIGDSVAGKGTKGEYTLDLSTLHGTGDTITLTGLKADGTTAISVNLTYDANNTSSNTFTGATVEDQAKSIADALKLDANIASNFEITTDGSKVTLTALNEGTSAATISNITTTDKTVALGADTVTAGVTKTGGKALEGGWDALFSDDKDTATTNDGLHVKEGDKLTFNVKGNNEEELSVTIEITADMLTSGTVEGLTNAVAQKLNAASFDDKAGTGIDESNIKFSDLFTATGNKMADSAASNNGGLNITAVNHGKSSVTNVVLTRDGATLQTKAASTAEQAGAWGANAVPEKHVVAAGTNNFSYGDVFKISGKTSDGQDLTVELVAGEDFDIGADYNTTMSNIVSALSSSSSDVTVKVGDTDVLANTVFGGTSTTASAHEFKVSATSGALTIESTKKGDAGVKGMTGTVTMIEVKPAAAAESSFSAEAAVAQQGASTSITLDENIKNEYGTAIKIGDTTYEIVKDARDVSNRNNEAIVVEDLANASVASITQKLADAIQNVDTAGAYNIEVQGNTLNISTVDVGSDVAAIEVSTPYGDEVTTASFKFDANVVEEGSILTFNGTSYEFVKAGEQATQEGAIAIEVNDFATDTAKTLGDAFRDVCTSGLVEVADDGTVTLKSFEGADGTISKPSISFGDGLTLQIGDTSADYNQLEVSIEDMHCKALGIDAFDIQTQESAQSAVDIIKSAINQVSMTRGTLGATQNRLEHTANNLSVMEENIQDAESSIRDTDIADEMTSYTKNNILLQSAQAMLAQANSVPQGVLSLLQ